MMKGDKDLDAMIVDLANDNDNILCSGNADMDQQNDTFCFQYENFIGVSINNANS